jgi:hypothetical protein
MDPPQATDKFEVWKKIKNVPIPYHGYPDTTHKLKGGKGAQLYNQIQ